MLANRLRNVQVFRTPQEREECKWMRFAAEGRWRWARRQAKLNNQSRWLSQKTNYNCRLNVPSQKLILWFGSSLLTVF